MTEVEVAGNTYDIGELNAVQQLNVARRLMLAFAKELPKFVDLLKEWKIRQATGADAADDEDGLKIFEPFAEAVGRISDEDFEMIVKTCCGVIKRKTKGSWARITPPGETTMMFKDIKAGTLVLLIWKVVEANLADFFPGLPQLSDEPRQEGQSS